MIGIDDLVANVEIQIGSAHKSDTQKAKGSRGEALKTYY